MQLTDYVTNKASNNLIPEFSLYCNFMADGSFYQKGLTKGFPYAMCSCYCILCYNKKGGSNFPVDFATKAPYLPTGFACYQCLPLLHQKLQPDCNPSIVVIVTPLKALMKDQVRLLRTDQSQLSNLIKLTIQVSALSRRGLRACYISGDQDDDLV